MGFLENIWTQIVDFFTVIYEWFAELFSGVGGLIS